MTRNVGPVDRVIRIVLGLGILSLVFFLEGNLRWIGLVGLIPLATAIFSTCPLYTVLGLSSCPRP